MFELKNATMIYDMDKEEKVYAMRNINISFPDKGLVGIIGPSDKGCRKTDVKTGRIRIYIPETLSGTLSYRSRECRIGGQLP